MIKGDKNREVLLLRIARAVHEMDRVRHGAQGSAELPPWDAETAIAEVRDVLSIKVFGSKPSSTDWREVVIDNLLEHYAYAFDPSWQDPNAYA